MVVTLMARFQRSEGRDCCARPRQLKATMGTSDMAVLSRLNFRIGAKLMTMSALGVVLVAGMIEAQLFGNTAIENASDHGMRQAMLARNVVEAKASVRGMQTGTRDIRLALSPEDLDKATKYIEARRDSAVKFIGESLKLSTVKENVER